MSNQTIQALPADIQSLVQRIAVAEFEDVSILKAEHLDPTWRGNFSYDSREMIKQQADCLRQAEAFEDATNADDVNNYDGRVFYSFTNAAAGDFLKQLAGKTLKELTDGIPFMTGEISLDLDELCLAFEYAYEANVPRSWFEENSYHVDAEGALVLGTAG